MNQRLILALLSIGLITLGAVVFVVAGGGDERARGPRTTEPATSPVVPASEAAPLAPLVPEQKPVPAIETEGLTIETPETQGARREAKSAYEEELADALWVEGRVLFPAGTPPDEECWVLADGRSFKHGGDHRVLAAPDGRFRVAFSKRTRKGKLRLDARYLILEKPLRVEPRKERDGFVLQPSLGGRITVRLVPAPGEEIQESEVTGMFHAVTEEGRGRIGGSSVSGDFTGTLDALPPATYRVSFSSAAFMQTDDVSVTVAAGETATLELPLVRGSSVSGIVVDGEGRPIEEAQIGLTVKSGDWTTSWPSRTSTDDEGRFEITGIEQGEVSLGVTRTGFISATRDVSELAEGREASDLRIVLERGASIRGTVVLASGEPAPGAWIDYTRVDVDDSYGQNELRVRAAEDGTFEVGGLGDQPVTLIATFTAKTQVEELSPTTGKTRTRTKRSQERGIAEDVAPGTDNLVLQIGAGNRLAGVVVDSHGAPVPSFRIRVQETGGVMGITSSVFSGSFEDPSGGFLLTGLPSGALELTVTAEGFGPSGTHKFRLPGEDTPLHIELGRTGTLAGVVLSPDGVPVARAAVHVEPVSRRSRREVVAHSKRDGSFVLDDIAPGEMALFARAKGYADGLPVAVQLAPDERRENLELRLRRAGTIEGEVLGVGDVPDANIEVSYRSDDASSQASTQTDEAGRFLFKDVAPGRGRVSAHATTEDAIAVFGEGAGPSEVDLLRRTQAVAVVEGETTHVLLALGEFDIVRVHGVVILHGDPLIGGWVSANALDVESQSSLSAETDVDGAYELLLPHAGRYMFSFFDQTSGGSIQTTETVPEGKDWALDLAFDPGAIEGVVRDSAGAPLAGIDVTAQPSQHEEGAPSSWAQVQTEADGHYLVSNLVDGTYEVLVGESFTLGGEETSVGSVIGSASRAGVRVTAGSTVRGVDFELSEGGKLRGRVSFEGTPAARSWVQVIDAQGGFHLGGMTDQVGVFETQGLPPGAVTVFASDSTGMVSRFVPALVEAGVTNEVDLELHVTGTLVIALIGGDGQPTRGEVHVGGGYDPMLRFLEDQTWTLGQIPAGEITVRGTLNGIERTRTVEVLAGETRRVELRFD